MAQMTIFSMGDFYNLPAEGQQQIIDVIREEYATTCLLYST